MREWLVVEVAVGEVGMLALVGSFREVHRRVKMHP